MNQKLIRKVKPQVYGLLLEFPNTSFLSVQCAYSLEEATMLAKIEFQKTETPSPNPQPVGVARINLFAIKTFEELNMELPDKLPFFNPIVPEKPVSKQKRSEKAELKGINSIKNILMKTIIERKGKITFKKYKETFTQAEQQFIKKHIK